MKHFRDNVECVQRIISEVYLIKRGGDAFLGIIATRSSYTFKRYVAKLKNLAPPI